jgi:hypothetical protein
MALKLINVGEAPNDNKGDPLRTAFIKINEMIAALNSGEETGLKPVLVTGDFTASVGNRYFVDNTDQGVDVTTFKLPTGVEFGDFFTIVGLFPYGTNNIILDAEGVNVDGNLAEGEGQIEISGSSRRFTFISDEFGWVSR